MTTPGGERGRAAAVGLVGALLAAPLLGQEIRLQLDRSEISIQEEVTLIVTVEGTRQADPELPDLADFDALYRDQSSQMEWVNGRVSRRVVHYWTLRPKRIGEFEIGPASVTLDGQTHTSDVVVLRVGEAATATEGAAEVFVTADVSDRRPFVGEQVVLVWRLFNSVRIEGASLESQDLGSLQVEDLGEVRLYRTRRDGVDYEVREIRKALFAQQPGVVSVPGWTTTVQVGQRSRRSRLSSPFDDFFSRGRSETRVLRTDPIELEVRPLPDAPEGFSGLVGDFAIRSSVSTAELAVGESLTQRVTVSGKGSAQLIGQPRLTTPTELKAYEDQPTEKLNRNGDELSGSKTFTRALVPLVPGTLRVDPVELVFFDPDQERYVRRVADAVDLTVVPGSGDEDLHLTESLASSGGKVAVRLLGDDLLPIYRGLDAIDGPSSVVAPSVLIGAPPLAFGVLLMLRRRARRYESDAGLRRRRTARRRVKAAIGAADGPDALSAALRGYVGDKCGRQGVALTAIECRELLSKAGVEDRLSGEVASVLGRLEEAQYAPDRGSRVDAATVADLVGRVEQEMGR